MTAIVIRIGVVIEANGLGVIGDGPVVVAFLLVSVTAIVIRIGIVGFEVNSLREVGDGLVVVGFLVCFLALC